MTIRGVLLLVGWLITVWHATPGVTEELSATGEEGRVRAQLVAVDHTTLSSEVAGRIARITARSGESFTRGQPLVQLDCAIYQTQLTRAEAIASGARKSHEVSRQLSQFNANSKLELEVAAARAAEAAATVSEARIAVKHCTIPAPFAGRVVKRLVEPHQYVNSGEPLLEILDPAYLQVELIAPSRWVGWLVPGTSFEMRVDELDRSYPGTVARLGSLIDPVSQSIPVVGEFSTPHPELLPGMSGWVAITPPRP